MAAPIFVLIAVFVAANVYVEARNPDLPWWNHSLSRYLWDARHWQVQQGGYYALAGAMALMAVWYASGRVTAGLCVLSALALVVLTFVRLPFIKRTPLAHRVHLGGAVVAFTAMTVYECWMLWLTPAVWFPLAGVAACLAFTRWAPNESALEEKAYALALLCGIVAIVGVPP